MIEIAPRRVLPYGEHHFFSLYEDTDRQLFQPKVDMPDSLVDLLRVQFGAWCGVGWHILDVEDHGFVANFYPDEYSGDFHSVEGYFETSEAALAYLQQYPGKAYADEERARVAEEERLSELIAQDYKLISGSRRLRNHLGSLRIALMEARREVRALKAFKYPSADKMQEILENFQRLLAPRKLLIDDDDEAEEEDLPEICSTADLVTAPQEAQADG